MLLGLRLKDMELQGGSGRGGRWWDKVDSKWKGWGADEWGTAGFRAVPNCVVRKSAYIAPGAVLMPSFLILGSYPYCSSLSNPFGKNLFMYCG